MDHVVTDSIKTNKYQHTDAIYNDPTFDTNSFILCSWTQDLLIVVTVNLRGGKKYRAKTVAGLT